MKELKPLKDMPREEAHRIFDAWLDGVELDIADAAMLHWQATDVLHKHCHYSIPVTYPEVPWHLIDDQYHWYAVNENGDSGFFVKEPFVEDYEWDNEDGYRNADLLKINNGTCHWTESKVRRPE